MDGGNESKIARIMARLEHLPAELKGKEVRVGWFESAVYEDGTPVAYVATIQEYGDPSHNIPPRPFLRTAIADRKSEWIALLRDGFKAVARDEMRAEAALDLVGLQAAGDIRKAITRVTSPPLSPITLLLRKWKRQGRAITGKTVGEAAATIAAAKAPGASAAAMRSADTSGVPSAPLQDTGLMVATLTHSVVETD